MNLGLHVQYYLKALDYYPHNLELTIENLQYALSYEPDHAQSLCLMGQIYMYYVKDYKKAKEYFEDALSADLDYPDHYKYLSILYIWIQEYGRAERLIDFAFRRNGMSLEILHRIRAMLFEYQGKLELAEQNLKRAKFLSQNSQCLQAIKNDISRIKAKQKQLKKSRKVKSKSVCV